MVGSNNECPNKCRSEGYLAGSLSRDPDVCPFQYLCTCIPCPAVNKTACSLSCSQAGKISLIGFNKVIGCNTCECQCKSLNCMKVCKDHHFETINNTYGCLDCKCLCPDIDCDVPCGGKGLGALKNDTFGCVICNGCRSIENEGEPFLYFLNLILIFPNINNVNSVHHLFVGEVFLIIGLSMASAGA